MLSARALRSVLPTLPRIFLRGPWYRTLSYDLLTGPPPGGGGPQPLWSGGAARKGARFTPRAAAASGIPAIECLHLAEDELTPLLEVTGVIRPPASPIALRFEPQVLITVDGTLGEVLDVTDAAVQRALGTTRQELTAPWVMAQSNYLAGRGPLPPTQTLGLEVFHTHSILGLRYQSAKNASGVGIVIFASRLVRSRDTLTVFNRPSGRLQQSLP